MLVITIKSVKASLTKTVLSPLASPSVVPCLSVGESPSLLCLPSLVFPPSSSLSRLPSLAVPSPQGSAWHPRPDVKGGMNYLLMPGLHAFDEVILFDAAACELCEGVGAAGNVTALMGEFRYVLSLSSSLILNINKAIIW